MSSCFFSHWQSLLQVIFISFQQFYIQSLFLFHNIIFPMSILFHSTTFHHKVFAVNQDNELCDCLFAHSDLSNSQSVKLVVTYKILYQKCTNGGSQEAKFSPTIQATTLGLDITSGESKQNGSF